MRKFLSRRNTAVLYGRLEQYLTEVLESNRNNKTGLTSFKSCRDAALRAFGGRRAGVSAIEEWLKGLPVYGVEFCTYSIVEMLCGWLEEDIESFERTFREDFTEIDFWWWHTLAVIIDRRSR